MLKRLLVVMDVLLLAGAGALGFHLHRIWTEPSPAAATPAPAPGAAVEAPPAPAAPRPPAPSAAAYGIIADRNLFTPTRTEVGPEPPKPAFPTLAANPVPTRPMEKPRLYGVVIGADGGAHAYLWDPQTKRVFGYKVGDSLAESRVEQINNDRVTLRRGAEVFEVLLRDPSKPKPPPTAQAAAPPVPAQVPGVPPGQPGAPGLPGMPGSETASPFATPGTPPVPGQPGVPGPVPFATPGAPQRPSPTLPGRGVRPGMPGSVPVPTQPPPSGDSGS